MELNWPRLTAALYGAALCVFGVAFPSWVGLYTMGWAWICRHAGLSSTASDFFSEWSLLAIAHHHLPGFVAGCALAGAWLGVRRKRGPDVPSGNGQGEAPDSMRPWSRGRRLSSVFLLAGGTTILLMLGAILAHELQFRRLSARMEPRHLPPGARILGQMAFLDRSDWLFACRPTVVLAIGGIDYLTALHLSQREENPLPGDIVRLDLGEPGCGLTACREPSIEAALATWTAGMSTAQRLETVVVRLGENIGYKVEPERWDPRCLERTPYEDFLAASLAREKHYAQRMARPVPTDLSEQEAIAYRCLRDKSDWGFYVGGFAPSPGPMAVALSRLAHSSDPSGAFRALYSEAGLGARLNALLALKRLDPDFFQTEINRYRSLRGSLFGSSGGCTGDYPEIQLSEIISELQSPPSERTIADHYLELKDGRIWGADKRLLVNSYGCAVEPP